MGFSQLGFADKRLSLSEASTRHNPSETKGGDVVPVPTLNPRMTIGLATLPLPPTKDKTVRQSTRGVAFIKPCALSQPSTQPQVSTELAGAQEPPSCVCQRHLEWIEEEVARRVAAALVLFKHENAPAASARASYKDVGTQVDAVIPTARASGAGNDRVCVEKKVFSKSLSRFLTLFPTIKKIFLSK